MESSVRFFYPSQLYRLTKYNLFFILYFKIGWFSRKFLSKSVSLWYSIASQCVLKYCHCKVVSNGSIFLAAFNFVRCGGGEGNHILISSNLQTICLLKINFHSLHQTHFSKRGVHGEMHKVLTYIEYRAVSGVFRTIDPPPPLHPASVSSPRTRGGGGGGVHIRRAVGG